MAIAEAPEPRHWLIGPFIDAWLRVYPDRRREARDFLNGLVDHLKDACVGSISEIFDAEEPYTARGCIAQAWGVAELLRSWLKVNQFFSESVNQQR